MQSRDQKNSETNHKEIIHGIVNPTSRKAMDITNCIAKTIFFGGVQVDKWTP
jgi:hypothetical protein